MRLLPSKFESKQKAYTVSPLKTLVVRPRRNRFTETLDSSFNDELSGELDSGTRRPSTCLGILDREAR